MLPSAPLSRNGLLLLGTIFHVAYIGSIFDIYFTSPLVHGMQAYSVPEIPSPARRLVLAVADGLRADRLYEPIPMADGEPRAPFLMDIVKNRGSWGVSHTRVPTESRPGHVAIIAGFYEDVSAVTKGWKMNPVEFDSVFNRSAYTWSYGSPDILPMFREGATNPERIVAGMYGHEEEDFGAEGSHLDEWVFSRMEELFASARTDSALAERLASDKIVFFLHLLGLDTNGHGFRPHSPEYINNIRIVDQGLKRMENLIESYYGHDGKTAYVFTADHGMGNRGAHGDGDPDNTRTPLIAWGAGVAPPTAPTSPPPQDDFTAAWGHLSGLTRKDVEQADIAPLMSSLLGLEYPVNSVGVLPIPYLGVSEEFQAHHALLNARQVLAQYEVKEAEKRSSEIAFRPFSTLSPPNTSGQEEIARIEDLIRQHHYTSSEASSQSLIHRCLEGLRYFQTYDWLFLRSTISAGYLGWIVYSIIYVLATYGQIGPSASTPKTPGIVDAIVDGGALLGLIILFSILRYQASPAMYYVYTLFPLFFWREIGRRRHVLLASLRHVQAGSDQGYSSGFGIFRALLIILSYILVLEALVMSYFNRSILSACFLLIAFAWPVLMPARFRARHWKLLIAWALSCLACAIFPSLAVEKGEDLSLVLLGGALVLVIGVAALANSHFLLPETSTEGDARKVRYAILTQLAQVILVLWVLTGSVLSLQAKEGLPRLNQLLGWGILLTSTTLPFLPTRLGGPWSHSGPPHYLFRLLTIYLAFAPPFLLLSISYEGLFYSAFASNLLLWLFLEYGLYVFEEESLVVGDVAQSLERLRGTGGDDEGVRDGEVPDGKSVPGGMISSGHRGLRARDARTAAFFLFFINVAFFGTGNVASISSFSLESVYRLTTVFDPFLMGALLIGKILIPFLLLSAVFGVLSRAVDLPPFSLFLLVLSTTDVMTLNFFYLVRDDGSWLEIGTSISHFCISSGFVVFTILLFWVSHLLIGDTLLMGGRARRQALGTKEN